MSASVDYTLIENYGFAAPDKQEEPELFAAHKYWQSYYPSKVKKQEKRFQALLTKQQKVASKAKRKHEFTKADTKNNDIKKMCRKGVPPKFRGKVWFQLSGAAEKMLKNPSRFAELKAQTPTDTTVKQINADIDRTFPEHPLFKLKTTQESLRTILCAYAVHNPKVGYCQSLNFLAATALLHLPSEEEAFWLFETILTDYLPEDLYDETLFGLYCECEVLTQLTKDRKPKIYALLKKLDFNYAIFATPWFMCVFLTSTPFETALRVWDSFFVEGYKVIFRASIALLGMFEDQLLKCTDPGQVLNCCIKNAKTVFDARKLIKSAFKLASFKKETILAYRKNYREKTKPIERKKKGSTSKPVKYDEDAEYIKPQQSQQPMQEVAKQ